MKRILTFLSLLHFTSTNATTKTVISNLDQGANKGWQNPANWLPAGVPESGDLVVIPPGKTISVKGNVYPTAVLLTIFIEGSLEFNPSGKLNLLSGSFIQLFTAESNITSNGSTSEQITIGGALKYSGQNDGTVTGPAFTNAASPNSTTSTTGAGFYVGVLPVQVTNFTVKNLGHLASINWTSQSESTTKKFELQRSTNTVDWTTLAVISPKNTCECATSYSLADTEPMRGNNYYRLAAVGIDAVVRYSPIAVMKMEAESKDAPPYSLTVSASELNLSIHPAAMAFPVKVSFFGTNGQMIKKQVATSSFSRIDITTLPKGLFILFMEDQQRKTYSLKVLK